MRLLRLSSLFLLLLLLAGCMSAGRGARVSEPAASIQQLTVDARGNWQVQLRLQNYSSIATRFDEVNLALEIDGQPAGTLQATPALSVPPESADIATVTHAPPAATRMALATALSSGQGVAYKLSGTVKLTPDAQKQRSYTLDASNRLSPVPGLPGVLR